MKRVMVGIMAGAFFLGTAFADDQIKDRKENQQDRIAQGVKSGQLTPGETSHIEKNESNLNKEIRTDRKQNGGNLTNKEKAQVNRQQNKLSKQIYKDKHNARTQK